MKVRSIEIQAFRNIDHLCLKFDPRLTVFLGVNGSGKSSILDSLHDLLSCYTSLLKIQSPFYLQPEQQKAHQTGMFKSFLRSQNLSWRGGRDLDIKNGSQTSLHNIKVINENEDLSWALYQEYGIGYILENSNLDILQDFIFKFKSKLENKLESCIPLFVCYSTNRVVSEIPLEVLNENFHLFQALDDVSKPSATGFTSFFKWFRNVEDLENERRRDDPTYKSPSLNAVRLAIPRFLDGFMDDLRVRRSPALRMTISKAGEELVINQLSDGEKCLLAMVGDLARRLSIANPDLEDPLQGEGIVLIDELELHLHPQWQRGVISKLLETFPNCQFIISTHSPQIVSDVKPENIYVLKSVENKITATHPQSSFGRDSNQILENVMGVSARPEKFKNQLNDLFRLIDEGKLDEARVLKSTLSDEIGFDEPQFSKANVLLRRKEVLGR